MKAVNDRILEWAYLLNLANLFRKYFSYIAPKTGFFFKEDLEGTDISEMAPKRRFLKGFSQFSGNKHSNSSDIWGLGLIN